MVRIVTTAVMASTPAVSSLSHAAEIDSGDNQHPGGKLTQRSTQNHMFDGISLTGHQRQQMRDLMQQARYEQPPVSVGELETVHHLVTAENFDENVMRTQAEKVTNEQAARRVEMAKVHNQIYCLLTPEQQATSDEKHQQRMEQLRDVTQ